MITIHHLGKSQSERILWLCEELGLPYELKHYTRDKVTILAPPELKALHPMQAAPLINDGDVLLAESGAIIEYILAKYGDGKLVLAPSHPDYAQYLYWFHFANSNLQANMGRSMVLSRLHLPADDATLLGNQARLHRAMDWVDSRVGEATWLAGDTFTAADIMIVFTLTTMRLFMPLDLAPWQNVLAYLQRVGARPAYQAAMRKGDPGMVPMLT
ncbi:MAG: glutathione S-transferase family protein [Comamonadaceae bacterium]|nr:MAG: glutathione S-transferase family protein [Comamonadaceae bacterium]